MAFLCPSWARGHAASRLVPCCRTITFCDHEFDAERMIRCTQLAGIHDEIMAMPMTYNSLIGDMGSSLSGGQKQRVLLARALYRGPQILFLDEGTAHLDMENERLINESLKGLNITRISVAHRPGISGSADRILVIAKTHVAMSAPSDLPQSLPRPPLSS